MSGAGGGVVEVKNTYSTELYFLRAFSLDDSVEWNCAANDIYIVSEKCYFSLQLRLGLTDLFW